MMAYTIQDHPQMHKYQQNWGILPRQLTSGTRILVKPDHVLSPSFYFHRAGHESAWVRIERSGTTPAMTFMALKPFLHLLTDQDVAYVMRNRNWFSDLYTRPLHTKEKV